MGSRPVAHGVAGLYLASGVSFLRAEESVFEAMVTGWRAQQLGGRGLGEDYVTGTVRAVRQFHAHAGSWPWLWSAGLFDEWMLDLVCRCGSWRRRRSAATSWRCGSSATI